MEKLKNKLQRFWWGYSDLVVLLSIPFSIIISVVILWNMTGYRDVVYIIENADHFAEVIGGYELGPVINLAGNPINGGEVYYIAKDRDGNTYNIAFSEWRGRLEVSVIEPLNIFNYKNKNNENN